MRTRNAEVGSRKWLLLSMLAMPFAPTGAAAQVGHDPEKSPYHDLRAKQAASIIGGHMYGQRGTPGVGPADGQFVSLRYDRQVGTAADIILALSGARLSQYRISSAQPAATQKSGPFTQNLLFMETGMSLLLTGRKSWHGFAPYIGATIGVVFETDLGTFSEFSFGTRGHLAPHFGIKWFPVQAIAVKVEARDIIWRLRYPETWFVSQGGQPAVLPTDAPAAEWLHHPTVTLSLGYTFTF